MLVGTAHPVHERHLRVHLSAQTHRYHSRDTVLAATEVRAPLGSEPSALAIARRQAAASIIGVAASPAPAVVPKAVQPSCRQPDHVKPVRIRSGVRAPFEDWLDLRAVQLSTRAGVKTS